MVRELKEEEEEEKERKKWCVEHPYHTCWGKHVRTECSVYPKDGPSNTAVGSFSTSLRNWSNFANIMTPLESEICEKISERRQMSHYHSEQRERERERLLAFLWTCVVIDPQPAHRVKNMLGWGKLIHSASLFQQCPCVFNSSNYRLR